MKSINLSADYRESSGSKQSKRLRRRKFVPGVLYEMGSGGTLLKIDEGELSNAISKNGENVMVNLKINGRDIPAVIKEIQKDSLQQCIIHVDFQPVKINEKIYTDVPIVLAKGKQIEKSGWVINKQMAALKVEGEVSSIPPAITIDASRYKVGQVMRVGDLELSEELSVISGEDEVIFSILPTKDRPVDLVFDRAEPELVSD